MPRSKSTLMVSSATAVGTGPKFRKFPLYRPGTRFALDFTDEFGANGLAVGAIPTASTLEDLSDPPRTASFNTGVFSNLAANGGIVSPGSGSGAQAITLGAAGDFQIPVGNELLFTLWLKQNAAAAANNAIAYMGPPSSTNGNACQFFVSSGTGGNTIALQVGTGSGVRNQASAANAAQGAPTQIALRYRPSDGLIQQFLNGVSNGSATSGALNMLDAAAMVFQISPRFNGTIYAATLTDMTEAMATETTWGYSTAEILDAPAHVFREYQFMTGALAGSPRTALV